MALDEVFLVQGNPLCKTTTRRLEIQGEIQDGIFYWKLRRYYKYILKKFKGLFSMKVSTILIFFFLWLAASSSDRSLEKSVIRVRGGKRVSPMGLFIACLHGTRGLLVFERFYSRGKSYIHRIITLNNILIPIELSEFSSHQFEIIYNTITGGIQKTDKFEAGYDLDTRRWLFLRVQQFVVVRAWLLSGGRCRFSQFQLSTGSPRYMFREASISFLLLNIQFCPIRILGIKTS